MAESGTGSSVILYLTRFSPFAWRTQLALAEKGIPYTPVFVDFSNKPKELLEANPIYGKIPTMVHDGNPICESAIILEYIEEAWPEKKPLMPKDALERSKVRFWTDYIYKGFATIIHLAMSKPGSPEREAGLAEVQKFYKSLDGTMMEHSPDGPFFAGDQFGYLDVVLAPLTGWMKGLEEFLQVPAPRPDEVPRLDKWMKTVKSYKTVRDTLPTDGENLEYFSGRLKAHKESQEAEAAGKK